MFALQLIFSAIVNAFGRRFAGGLLSQWVGRIGGTQVARLVQAALVGLTVAFLAPAWWMGAAAIPLAFSGAVWGFPVYLLQWPFIELRRSNMVPTTAMETVSLSINGMIACAPLALGAWWIEMSWWWLLIAGLGRGPVYWLAAAFTPPWRWMGFEEWAGDQQRWILQPTALAEAYSGALLGVGIVLAFTL